jgi:hypothetical protein
MKRRQRMYQQRRVYRQLHERELHVRELCLNVVLGDIRLLIIKCTNTNIRNTGLCSWNFSPSQISQFLPLSKCTQQSGRTGFEAYLCFGNILLSYTYDRQSQNLNKIAINKKQQYSVRRNYVLSL